MRSAVDYLRTEEAAMAAEIGGTFIDLTTVFDSVAGQVFTDYAHLTPLGNELVARQILSEILPLICERSLMGAEPPDVVRLRAYAATGCSDEGSPV